MDDGSPRALSDGRAGARLDALLALAWWGLLALLVWVCFLREAPRGLALTAAWFATPNTALLCAVLVLLLAGALRVRIPGPGRMLALLSVAAGLLTLLSWCATALAS